jgi:lysophospholipase
VTSSTTCHPRWPHIPELALGGPSVLWVKAALEETSTLMSLPAPDMPTVTLVGTRESIVEVPAIEARMASWPKGTAYRDRGRSSRGADGGPGAAPKSLDAILGHFETHA